MRIQNWRSFFLWVPLLFCSLLMGSCNAIDIHPYDCNISGEQDINRRHIQELAGTFGKNVLFLYNNMLNNSRLVHFYYFFRLLN